ncbi:PEP-CTERM sorting domain-containing protein [Aeoliella sp.]|uniref:PEP-CTERM sorting domain-containing protein n=1 Tax=Aeoliella sp. TaxID=2795800 RepID=UPI003CCC0D92
MIYQRTLCFLASLTLIAGLTSPAHAGGEEPPVDVFKYFETFDFSGPDLGDFPQGISSIGRSTGGEFAEQSVDSNGKSTFTLGGDSVPVDNFLDAAAGVSSNNSRLLDEFTEAVKSNAIFANRILIALGASEFTTPAIEEIFTTGVDAQTYSVGNSDPYLARRIEVTNPFDETTTFRFEAALETVPLDPLTATAEGRFSAEVFDTGGDIGAELVFNLGHTIRQADSLEDLALQLDHSGTINEGEISTLDVDPITGFAVALEDFDRILSSVFLTLSPGDTAVVTTIGNFGDETFPLASLTNIEADLATSVAVGNLSIVPEPASVLLLCLGSFGLLIRRRTTTSLDR